MKKILKKIKEKFSRKNFEKSLCIDCEDCDECSMTGICTLERKVRAELGLDNK